jgi:hypothetical protein
VKYILDEEYEYDFDLLGICCHEKDYRLCWALNNLLKISLEKSKEEIEIIFSKSSKPNARFPLFKFTSENLINKYYLIGNKFENSWLIPEKQHVDYFLMLKSSEKINCIEILEKLQSIPFVLTSHSIAVDQLKSKKNLIF